MIDCKMKADTKLTVVMWSQKFDKKTMRHLAAVSAGGNLLASYLSTCLGSAAARPGENFDAHPRRPAPSTAEFLQSLSEKARNSP